MISDTWEEMEKAQAAFALNQNARPALKTAWLKLLNELPSQLTAECSTLTQPDVLSGVCKRLMLFFRGACAAEALAFLIGYMDAVPPAELSKFVLILELIDSLVLEALRQKSTLSSTQLTIAEGTENQHLAQLIHSFSDRVFNFMGATTSREEARDQKCHPLHEAMSIVQRFRKKVEEGIKQFLIGANAKLPESDAERSREKLPHASQNFHFFSLLIADSATQKEGTNSGGRALIRWMLERPHYARTYPRLLANEAIVLRKHDALISLLVEEARNGVELQILLGNSVLLNSTLKRILMRKIHAGGCDTLVGALSAQRGSRKIADYFNGVDCNVSGRCATEVDGRVGENLVEATFMQLLQIFADQACLFDSVPFHQQYQVAVALLDFGVWMRERREMSGAAKWEDEIRLLLISAMPEFLSLGEKSRRHIGMFVTETLLNWLTTGNTEAEQKVLNFEYDQSNDPLLAELRRYAKEREEENGVIEEMDAAEENTKRSKQSGNKKACETPFTSLDALALEDNENEGEKDYGEGSQHTAKLGPFYLRDCLEALGREEEDCLAFQRALKVLPSLLAREGVVGLTDVAPELLDRLIALDSQFGMDDYMELRLESIKLLFVKQPYLFHKATRLLFSAQCSMPNRYLILNAAEAAVSHLAKGCKEEGQKQSSSALIVEENNDEGGSPTQASSTSEDVKGEGGRSTLGHVTRKSRSLETKKKTVERRMNNLDDALPSFILPLLHFEGIGEYLDLWDRDHILLAKILTTISQLVEHGKNTLAIARLASSIFLTLLSLRRNKHPLVSAGCLLCYAALAESLPSNVANELMHSELTETLEWMISAMGTGGMFSDENCSSEHLMYALQLAFHSVQKALTGSSNLAKPTGGA